MGNLVRGWALVGASWRVLLADKELILFPIISVVPVMIVEGQGPFTAIQRSTALLKRTWGEQIGGSLGMGGVFLLLALPGALPAALGLASGITTVIVVGIALTVVYWAVLAIVASALSQIFRAAVYLYATDGAVPAQFEPWMVQRAFAAR
jgi:hypothetical protein